MLADVRCRLAEMVVKAGISIVMIGIYIKPTDASIEMAAFRTNSEDD